MTDSIDAGPLYARLPHAGAMCLVDTVSAWDRETVECRSRSHLDTGNPLRIGSKLSSICALEYAAQAFALHGLLVADEYGDQAPDDTQIFVALTKDLQLHAARLDDEQTDLIIKGQVIFQQSGSAVYRFEVTDNARLLVTGQVGLMSGGSTQ